MTATDPRRILLALDACGVVDAALLDLVVGLAAGLGANLEGLFVEDEELLSAAALPFVSEISAGGREQSLTPEGLLARGRDVSRDVGQLLLAAARARSVPLHYRTVRGGRLATVFAAAEHCDLFMPARPGRRQRHPREPRLSLERVALIVPAAAPTPRALDAVQALAAQGQTREVLLVCEGTPPPGLLRSLAEQRLRSFVHSTSFARPGEVLRDLQTHAPDLLVAPKSLLLAPATSRALESTPLALLLLE